MHDCAAWNALGLLTVQVQHEVIATLLQSLQVLVGRSLVVSKFGSELEQVVRDILVGLQI